MCMFFCFCEWYVIDMCDFWWEFGVLFYWRYVRIVVSEFLLVLLGSGRRSGKFNLGIKWRWLRLGLVILI